MVNKESFTIFFFFLRVYLIYFPPFIGCLMYSHFTDEKGL